jgi:hypothetical protein
VSEHKEYHRKELKEEVLETGKYEPKTGDIVFFRTKLCWYKPASWLAYAIRKIAKIDYNHTGVLVRVWDEPFIIEALGRGILTSPLEKRIDSKDIRICRPNRDIDESVYAKKAVSFLSTKYDIIGLIFHQLIWNLFSIWIGAKKAEAKKRMYCYEYVALMK